MKTKQQLILEEIVLPYHPVFQRDPELRQKALDYPEYFNAEHLTEITMAHVGGYQFVDENRYDFSDYSECKTATINRHDRRAVITNVVRKLPKIGDLRVVLYNPCRERLDYYFMPRAEWEIIREHNKDNRSKLRATYVDEHDYIIKWHQWRVPDFETLATRASTVTDPTPWMHDRSPLSSLFYYEDDEDD